MCNCEANMFLTDFGRIQMNRFVMVPVWIERPFYGSLTIWEINANYEKEDKKKQDEECQEDRGSS